MACVGTGDIHQVQVYQLLLVQVGGRDVLEDVGEQGRHVLAQGHGHDGLLNGLLALVGVLRHEPGAQLERLALARARERPLYPIDGHRGREVLLMYGKMSSWWIGLDWVRFGSVRRGARPRMTTTRNNKSRHVGNCWFGREDGLARMSWGEVSGGASSYSGLVVVTAASVLLPCPGLDPSCSTRSGH